jgi:hypothetical protein
MTKIVFTRVCKGVQFRVRETGMNWTIDAKEKNSKSFKRVQAVDNLNLAKQIIGNQNECKEDDMQEWAKEVKRSN